MSMPAEDAGPVERSIRTKLAETLKPLHLEVTNDSHLHAHHAAMRAVGGGNGESHFTVDVVSSAFEGKRQMQRHRLIYSTLQTELDAGLHALVIKAKTPEEAGLQSDAERAEAAPASGGEQAPAGP